MLSSRTRALYLEPSMNLRVHCLDVTPVNKVDDPSVTEACWVDERDAHGGQPVTPKLYKAHNGKWFAGKRAVALRNLVCSNGESIRAYETVTIKRKWAGFIVVTDTGASAWRVPPEALSLL